MLRNHGIFDYKIEIGGTPAGPPAGYIAWWKFEDNLNDVTGNFNATLGAGTATYVTGKNGKAFSFNGSTYLNTPLTRDKWILGTHSFTVNAWVKSSQTGRFYILSSANSGGGAPAILCCEGGYVGGMRSDAWNWYGSSYQGFNGNWNMFTIRYDSTTKYFGHKLNNGSWVQRDEGTKTVADEAFNFVMGTAGGAHTVNYNGLLDSVIVYDKALTDSEITTLYNSGSGW